MEERESSERKSLLIKTIIIIILLLLAFLSTILYVYTYPKTRIELYDTDYSVIQTFEVKRYSTLANLKGVEKAGYTFEYWSYDDFGGRQLDPNAELKSEVLKLYANYTVNRYKVTYHIQYFDETLGQYQYKIYEPFGYANVYDYGSEFTLPTGRRNGVLLEDFTGRKGYHFSGWTTKVMSEDDVDIKKYFHPAGSNFVLDVPSNVDLYAFFEKNTYNINLHTGVEYVLGDDGMPLRDDDNEYIIKNLSNPTIDNDGLLNATVRFQDELKNTLNLIDLKLTENNAGIAYGEYEFLGWYLDEDYKISLADNNMTLNVDDDGRPYYLYRDNGVNKRIESVDTGDRDQDNNPIYEFNAYSKWRRKSYAISFEQTKYGADGRIAPIYLYKIFLDEDGNYAGDFEKYYDEGEFNYEGYNAGKHYARLNLDPTLASPFVTLKVRGDEKDDKVTHRLIGWTNKKITTDDDVVWYALWTQEDYTDDMVIQRQTATATYKNPIYIHTISEDAKLYSQWSQLYRVVFNSNLANNKQNFAIRGILNEWFVLPNLKYIEDTYGYKWEKSYNYFAGWTSGGSFPDYYYEKDANGQPNPKFVYKFTSRQRTDYNLYVNWQGIQYSSTYYLNDGTDTVYSQVSTIYGGKRYYHPAKPTREGYIFDGWSQVKYADGEYSRLVREAKDNSQTLSTDMASEQSSYTCKGDAKFYASWTIDYEIEYDANGGEFTSTNKTLYKFSELLGNLSRYDLKARLTVGYRVGVKKENYVFSGWNVKKDNKSVYDHTLSSTNNSNQQTYFDFYEMKYYKAGESSRYDFSLQNNKKVVLVAKWEPVKYNITIVNTGVGKNHQIQRLSVAFNEKFTFPAYDIDGTKYDSIIGYQLVGFATSEGGTPQYLIDGDIMPSIEAETISSNLTFYTVFEKKTIEVVYKFAKPTEAGVSETIYYPSGSCTIGATPYGSQLYLPTPTGVEYGGSLKYQFKYWFYVTEEDNDKDFFERKRYQVNNGDTIQYCDSENKLNLYAWFEVESYSVTVSITNPYTNTEIETINLGNFEKNSEITSAIYDDILSKVYLAIATDLEAYQIKNGDSIVNGVLKGYTLNNLQSKTFKEVFSAGKSFSSNIFYELKDNSGVLKLVTSWNAQTVNVMYFSSEENDADTSTVSTFKFNNTITTASNDLFDLGTKKIQSWYLKVANGNEENTYVACNAVLAGTNGKFVSLLDLIDYMEFDQSGVGTIKIYANTEQMCSITYYAYNYATGELYIVDKQEFAYGVVKDLRSGTDLNTNDLRFEGWYCNGSKITSLPALNKDNNYTLEIYANFEINVKVYDIEFSTNRLTEVTSRTISVLQYNSNTNKYSYLLNVLLNASDTDNLADKSNYTLYGLKYNDNVYTLDDIRSGKIKIALTTTNVELQAYYVREFSVTYTVENGATFDDDTVADKIDKVTVDYKGNLIKSYSINYSAKKDGYIFVGWKIKNGGNAIYTVSTIFTPSEDTTFVTVFKEPDANTIDVTIRLYKLDYDSSVDELSKAYVDYAYKNGNTFTFTSSEEVDNSWTSIKETLYAWKDLDTGKEYAIGQIYNIPRTIKEGTCLRFAGLWIEKYELRLTQPANFSKAEYSTKSKSLKKGERYLINETPTISTDGIKFNYWKYYLSADDSYAGADIQTDDNGRYIAIEVGDEVRLSSDYSGYSYIQENGVGIHSLRVDASTNTCELVGDWTTQTYTLTFRVKNPTDATDIKQFTISDVPFGTSYSDRDVLTQEIIALESDISGIIGWTDVEWGTDAKAGILDLINKDMTLYAVWQNKHTLTFADATEEFEYNDEKPGAIKFLANETIDLNTIAENNVTKSVVSKNYTTVFYENGAWVVVLDKGTTYAQLTGFRSSVMLNSTSGEKYDIISIGEGNVFETFIAPDSDVVLTPIISRTYKVSFFENDTEDGGKEIDNYTQYLRQSQTLNIDTFTLTRTKFTFLGWNTSPNADDALIGASTTITMGTADIKLYAVWSSARKVKFNVKIPNASGTSTTILLTYPLTKNNTINSSIIEAYLKGETVSGNGVTVYNKLDKNNELQDLKHNVYVFNFKNYMLDGFKVIKNSLETTFTLDELCVENFGSSYYNINSDVEVTLNLFDVYTVNYTATTESGTSGSIAYKNYFVAIDDTRTGKLIADGKFEDLTLMDRDAVSNYVTRSHFIPSAWSTKTDNSGVAYYFSSPDSLTISKDNLSRIANDLKSNYTQNYTLYLKWEYEYITVNIYGMADIGDESADYDTKFIDPYDNYLASSNETELISKFKVISNFIYSGSDYKFKVKNYLFNNGTSTPQLKYNDTFSIQLPSDVIAKVGAYTLVGFSTQLYKLGASIDAKDYYTFKSIITLDDSILNNEKVLNLYPVYVLNNEYVTVSAIGGSAEVTLQYKLKDRDAGNYDNVGYVYIPDVTEKTDSINADETHGYVVHANTYLVVKAGEPSSSIYVFNRFEGIGVNDESNKEIRYFDCRTLFAEHEEHSHNMSVIFATAQVTVNINMQYEVALKSGYTDNGAYTFAGTDFGGQDYVLTLGGNNLNAKVVTGSDAQIRVSNTTSSYYTYVLRSGEKYISLIDGNKVNVSALSLIADGNNYSANITIIATPKTNKVIFNMSKGTINSGAKLSATNIYFGDTLVEINQNVAYIYVGSVVTLPTATVLSYNNGGKFVGFYLNGDPNRTTITEHALDISNTNSVTFIEKYLDNVYTIEYIYMGKTTRITVEPNSVVSIGVEPARTNAGYKLQYWAYANGEKAFDDKQTITVDKSYILHAVYVGENITVEYQYDTDLSKSKIVNDYENGKDVVTLKESDLDDRTEYDTKYIYGWKVVNGTKIYKAGSVIPFNETGFVYGEGSRIVLQAIYYDKYKYTITYSTTDTDNNTIIINAGLFVNTDTYVYLNGEDSYDESELSFKINNNEPIHVTSEAELYFNYYEVYYSLDSGVNFTADSTNKQIKVGGTITLLKPIDADNPQNNLDINTPVIYKLVPQFTAEDNVISITYNITNPETNEVINDTLEANIQSKLTRAFSGNNLFGDEYLPTLTTTAGSSEGAWNINKFNFDFKTTFENIDVHKYVIVGYEVKLYNADNALIETRNFELGVENNRNIDGSYKATITTVWARKYVIYYHDQANNILETKYIDNVGIDSISLSPEPSLANIGLNGYTCVGWTKNSVGDHVISELSDYTVFGGELTLTKGEYDINLYPAQSKNYTIQFVTTGVDKEDESYFVLKEITNPLIYVGYYDASKELFNTIDLSYYKILANLYDTDKFVDSTLLKYELLGFGTGSTASDNYTLSIDDVNQNIITLNVIWSKKSYDINFEFVGLDATENNILSGIQYSVRATYGTQFNFGFDYKDNTYTFANGDNIVDSNNTTLQEKINLNVLVDYLRLSNFVSGSSAVVNYTVTGGDTITVNFVPVYRLAYVLPYGASYENNDKKVDATNDDQLLGEVIIKIGDNWVDGNTYGSIYSVDNITKSGYKYKYWSKDNSTNFFADNSHTFTEEELKQTTVDYRIKIYPIYETEYTVYLYYFESSAKVDAYINSGDSESTRDKSLYTQLVLNDSSLNKMTIGQSIMKLIRDTNGNLTIAKDADGNPISVWDGNFELTINGQTINKVYQLFDVFTDKQYVSYGLVTIESGRYLIDDGSRIPDNRDINGVYLVQNYNGTLENHLYLTYEPIKHNVQFFTGVATLNADNSYELVTNEKHHTYAEFALTAEQLNDDGSDDVAQNNRRRYAYDISQGFAQTAQVDFKNTVYLIDNSYITSRISNNSYNFVGWKVLRTDSEGNQILIDLASSGLTVTNVNKNGKLAYIEVSGFVADDIVVAVFTAKSVEVEVELSSTDNIGDKLELDFVSSMFGVEHGLYDFNKSVNSDTHSTKYTFGVLAGSALNISVAKEFIDLYQIYSRTDGSNGSIYFEDEVTDCNIVFTTDDIGKTQVIKIKLTYKTYEVKFNVYNEIENTKYYGGLTGAISYQYKINASDETYVEGTTTITAIGNNYSAYLPTTARINASNIGNAILNNFDFAYWTYLDTNSVTQKLGNNYVELSSIVYDNKATFDAHFTAKSVNVKFIIREENADNSYTEKEILGVDGINSANLKYGDIITLPSVIVETDKNITIGWLNSNNKHMDFGSEYRLLTKNNSELNEENGVLEFYIVAETTALYFIEYSAGATSYDISAFTDATSGENKFDHTITLSEVNVEGNYYFGRITADAGSVNVERKDGGYFKNSKYTIPNLKVEQGTEVNDFGGWSTIRNNTYENGSEIKVSPYEVESNKVTLTATSSTIIKVKFYITDPSTAGKVSLSNKKENATTASMEFITINIQSDTANNEYVDFEASGSEANIYAFVVGSSSSVNYRYFAQMANAYEQYRFVGWATEATSAYASYLDINNKFNTDNSVLYYTLQTNSNGTTLTKNNSSLIATSLRDFVANADNRELYPIWEQKHLVQFVDDNGDVLTNTYNGKKYSQYYGFNETVTVPTQESTKITNGNNKLIGWQTDSGRKTIELKSNKNNLGYVYYYGEYAFVGENNETWMPKWESGYSLTLDSNFGGDNRTYLIETLSQFGSSSDAIKASLGYPYFEYEGDINGNMIVPTGDSVTITNSNGNSNTVYYSQYKYGSLWGIKDKINLSGYNLTDLNIYPTDNFALTPMNTYFEFIGWSKTQIPLSQMGNMTEQQLKDLLITEEFSLTEDTTIYAVWRPRNVTITLYKDSDSVSKDNVSSDNKMDITILFGTTFNISKLNELTNGNSNEYLGVTKDAVIAFVTNPNHRFKTWRIGYPTALNLGTDSNVALINGIKLYPEYDDEYTVIFKASNGNELGGQADNYQRVIAGETVKVKSWLTDTLKQDLDLISEVYFRNNVNNNQYFARLVDNTLVFDAENIVFDASMLSTSERASYVMSIYVTIEFTLELKVPTQNSSEFETKTDGTLKISPENEVVIRNGGVYITDYIVSTSAYSTDFAPKFVGWHYYEKSDLDSRYKVSVSEIIKFKITNTVDGYKLVINSDKEYSLTTDNKTISTIQFYAKLLITTTIELGTENDDKISTFATFSYLQDSVDNGLMTVDGSIKSYKFTSVYGSDKPLQFMLETEGYNLDGIYAYNLTEDNSIGYENHANSISDTQNIYDEVGQKYNFAITKSIELTKTIDGKTITGQFIKYNIDLSKLTRNGYTYYLTITPFTYDVTYIVNSSDGTFLQLASSSAEEIDFTFTENTTGTINMLSEDSIYYFEMGAKVVYGVRNRVVMSYSTKQIEINDTTYNVVTFTGVPYGMSIHIASRPNEAMYKHLSKLTFNWNDAEYIVADATETQSSEIPSVKVVNTMNLTNGNGKHRFVFTPVTYDGNVLRTDYSITFNYDINQIKEFKLYLNVDEQSYLNIGDDTNNAWANVVKKYSDKDHISTSTNYLNSNGNNYNRYTISWKTIENSVSAKTNISDLLSGWINDYHEAYDKTWTSDSASSSGTYNLAQLLRYFVLSTQNDGKEAGFYSQDTSLVTTTLGYLSKDGNNTIYSLHNGTVELFVDLSPAYLTQVYSQILDYINADVLDTEISRATLGVDNISNASSTVFVYVANEAGKIGYVANNRLDNKNNLYIKAPYNSKVKFTVTPADASSDNVSYSADGWGTNIDKFEQNSNINGITVEDKYRTATLDTTSATSQVYNAFSKDSYDKNKQSTIPEIKLIAYVIADTYKVNFTNINLGGGKQNETLEIAYDRELANDYSHYGYTLLGLYNSSIHNMPKFKPATADNYGFAFVSLFDEFENEYGKLTKIFSQWNKDGVKFENADKLVDYDIINNSYKDITLKAKYENAVSIEFRKHVSFEDAKSYDTYVLYLQPHEFTDQFGVGYSERLLTDDLKKWSSTKGVYSVEGDYYYYLQGADNLSSVRVTDLTGLIENKSLLAYVDDRGDVDYVVWPRIDIRVNKYNFYVPDSARTLQSEITYATLGGMIKFTASEDKLILSNLIVTDAELDENKGIISSIRKSNYSFAMWYVDDTAITTNYEHLTITTVNIYPHYNAGIYVESGFGGNISIFNENGTKLDDFNLNVLASPSYKYITSTNGADGSYANVIIRYKEKGTENGYSYGVLEVCSNDSVGNISVIYTLKFTATETYFDSVGWQISTAYSNKTYTLNQIWSGDSSISNKYCTYFIDDANGAIKIYPVAYPKEVQININPTFVITNIANPNAYADAFTYSNNSIKLEGGALFRPTIDVSNGNYLLNFRDVSNSKDLTQYLSLNPTSIFEQIKDNIDIKSLRFEYYNESEWKLVDEDTRAIQFGATNVLKVRLACEWITYSLSLNKLGDRADVPNTFNGFSTPTSETMGDYNFAVVNGQTQTIVTKITIFKGDTISFASANDLTRSGVFTLTSMVSGVANLQILTNVNSSIPCYDQGYLVYQNKTFTAVSDKDTWSPTADIELFAWIEKAKDISLVVDESNYGNGFLAGLGNVDYTITSPLGRQDTQVMCNPSDVLNKTYDTLVRIGYSSKVNIVASKNTNYNHVPRSVKYSSSGESTAVVGNSDITVNTSAENIDGRVLIAFDASSTISTMYLLADNGQILRSNSIYGGYTFEYVVTTGSTPTLQITTVDYFGVNKNTFTIRYLENGTNTQDTYFPRDLYYIDKVLISSLNSVYVKDNYVYNEDKSNISGGTAIVEDTNASLYTGNGNSIVFKYSEYLHQVKINYKVVVKNPNGTTIHNSLSSNYAYIVSQNGLDRQNIASYTYNVDKSNRNFAFINASKDSAGFMISNISEDIYPGRTSTSGYNLTALQLFSMTDNVNPVFTAENTFKGGNDGSYALVEKEYDLYIYVNIIENITLTFTTTLPGESIKYLFAKTEGVDLSNWVNDNDAELEWNLISDGVPSVSYSNGRLTITGTGGSGYGQTTAYIYIGNDRNTFILDGWTKNGGDLDNENIYESTSFELCCKAKTVNLYVDDTYWYNCDMSAFDNSDEDIYTLLSGASMNSANYYASYISGGTTQLEPDNVGVLYIQSNGEGQLGAVNGQITLSNKLTNRKIVGGFKLNGSYITLTNGGYVIFTDADSNAFDCDLTYGSDSETINILLVYYPIVSDSYNVTFVTNNGDITTSFAKTSGLALPGSDRYDHVDNVEFYLGTSRATRCTIGLSANSSEYNGSSNSAGFNCTPITFYIDDQASYNNCNKNYISGYKVEINGSTTIYSAGTLVNLTGNAKVTPIWSYINQYTVTIDFGCGRGSHTTMVDAGGNVKYDRSGLGYIYIEDPNTSYNYIAYTYNSNGQFVVGYTWEQDGQTQIFRVLSEDYTNSTNGFVLDIEDINEDITIEPIIEDLGVTYTYEPAENEEDLNADSVTMPNRVMGLTYDIPYPNHNYSDGYTLYFYNDYEKTESASTSVGGGIIYYSSVHTNHIYNVNDGIIYGTPYYPDGSCDEVRTVSGKMKCAYCDDYISLADGIEETGNDRHDWYCDPDQDWEYDENEHWLIEDCITENGCGGSRNASVGTHDANRYVVMKSATCTENGKGVYYCSVCGCKSREVTIQATGHTWDSGEGTCVKSYTCTNCGETKTEGSHTPSSTIYYDQCISRSQNDKDTYHWALRRCTVCGCDLTQDGAEIDNYNSIWSTHREYHTGGYVTAISPTGDQMNNTAKTHVVTYSSCSKCNKSSYKQTVACEGVYVTCEIVNGKHLANYKCALCDGWWTEGCPGGDECTLVHNDSHTWADWEDSEDSSSLADKNCGYTYTSTRKCKDCGIEETKEIIHTCQEYNGDWDIRIVTNDVYHWQETYCPHCDGIITKGDYVKHTWEDKVEEEGNKVPHGEYCYVIKVQTWKECSECGKTGYYRDTIDSHTHDVTISSNDIRKGYCSTCGSNVKMSNGVWVVDYSLHTCVASDDLLYEKVDENSHYERIICEICGDTMSETEEPHVFNGVKCTLCGYTKDHTHQIDYSHEYIDDTKHKWTEICAVTGCDWTGESGETGHTNINGKCYSDCGYVFS